jgi:hypothetical protein
LRSVAADLALDGSGWLAAAARLDAIGVEILEAIEREGGSEAGFRLLYFLDILPPGEEKMPRRLAFAPLPRLVALSGAPPGGPAARIVALGCEARPRPPVGRTRATVRSGAGPDRSASSGNRRRR